MKKFKYLKLSKTKKLRFIDNYFKKKLYIVFLPGFMSDIEGKKPQYLLKFAKRNKLGFLSLEYSGHGKSSGDFIKGNIGIWSNDTKRVIKKVLKNNNFTLSFFTNFNSSPPEVAKNEPQSFSDKK